MLAVQCDNLYDPITLTYWNELDNSDEIIIIEVNNKTRTGFLKSSLIESLSTGTQLCKWIETSYALEKYNSYREEKIYHADENGKGSEPLYKYEKDTPIYVKLPVDFVVFVDKEKTLKLLQNKKSNINSFTTYHLKITIPDLRIGNLEGCFWSGCVHGQAPGFPIAVLEEDS